MATQYEVEHNIKPSSSNGRRRRQVDMSTFTSHLHQILPDGSDQHNPHATPNPNDLSAMFRLLQDQFGTLAATSLDEGNREFLRDLVESLDADILRPPVQVKGLDQQFIDSLDRVPRETLLPDDTCPICAEKYLDDQYCLVVELPCHHSHRFDLECVAPWLLGKGTCPLCRKDLGEKRDLIVEDDEDNHGLDGLYA